MMTKRSDRRPENSIQRDGSNQGRLTSEDLACGFHQKFTFKDFSVMVVQRLPGLLVALELRYETDRLLALRIGDKAGTVRLCRPAETWLVLPDANQEPQAKEVDAR